MPARADFTMALLRASGASTLAASARHLAQAGVPVFPCRPSGKRPLTTRGFHDATTADARVDAWWSRTPEANLGVPTGAVSGMVVVDVDVHGPVDGRQAFAGAERAGLVDGWGLLVETPTGGLHADVPSLLAASVAAVPPVVLLAITHLTVILTRTPAPQAHPAVWSVSSRSRGDAPSDPAISPGPGVEGKPTPLSRDERGAAVPDRRARGWELRQSGWSNKRIARELQVHPSTVGRWFAAAHLPDTNDETAAERKETTP